MRKLLVGIAVLASVLLVVPAAQAQVNHDLIKAEFVSARFTRTGAVRVVGQITCPVGYEVVGSGTSAQISQWDPGAEDPRVSVLKDFSGQVGCSGYPDRFTVRFARDFDQQKPFEADNPIYVDIEAAARATDSSTYPRHIVGSVYDSFTLSSS